MSPLLRTVQFRQVVPKLLCHSQMDFRDQKNWKQHHIPVNARSQQEKQTPGNQRYEVPIPDPAQPCALSFQLSSIHIAVHAQSALLWNGFRQTSSSNFKHEICDPGKNKRGAGPRSRDARNEKRHRENRGNSRASGVTHDISAPDRSFKFLCLPSDLFASDLFEGCARSKRDAPWDGRSRREDRSRNRQEPPTNHCALGGSPVGEDQLRSNLCKDELRQRCHRKGDRDIERGCILGSPLRICIGVPQQEDEQSSECRNRQPQEPPGVIAKGRRI